MRGAEKQKHCHGITRKSQKQKKEQEEALPRNYTEKHGIKMRRQKKDWTSAYAKVTKAWDKVDDGAGDTSSFPSFHAKAGNPEIQAAKERQIKGEASFLDLSSLAYFAS